MHYSAYRIHKVGYFALARNPNHADSGHHGVKCKYVWTLRPLRIARQAQGALRRNERTGLEAALHTCADPDSSVVRIGATGNRVFTFA
jgi:hypothetical protein